MKILLVTAGFLPDGLGGVELSMARFARWAQMQGHEVAVFRRLDRPDEPDFSVHRDMVQGIPVIGMNYRFSDATDFLYLVNNPRIRRCFEETLGEFAPDLVHVHHLTCLTTEVVDACKERGVPVVLSLHDYWMGCPRGQRIMADLSYCPDIEVERCTRCYRETWPHWFPGERRPSEEHRIFGAYHARIMEVLDLADALVVPSPFARDVFSRYGVDRDRLEVVEYGMDVDAYRGTTRPKSAVFRFGFLGTVLPSKGVHLLVDAFLRIAGSDRALQIHGPILPFHQDHSYEERLAKLVGSARGQIHFHGAYQPEDVGGILSRLDALVVPSIWYETYCMVIREGFLAGVPVIASNFGAMAEAIDDGKTGLLFDVGDSVHLAAQMERLARDRDLWQRLVESKKKVRTTEENGQQTLLIYDRLMKGQA